MTREAMERAITGTLEKRATGLRAAGRGRWEFQLANGNPLPVSARWEDDWFVLRAPCATGLAEDVPWRLLVMNGGLRGQARIARAEASARMELRADIPLAEVDTVPVRLDAACESLRRAGAAVAGYPKEEPDAHPEAGDSDKNERPWARLAAEHGWPVTERGEDRVTVELDTPGLFNQGLVEKRGAELAVSLELIRSGAVSVRARRAMALYLLTLTGVLRMVRAAVSDEPPHTFRLEVALPSPPGATELDLALSALSLACRMAAREVRALTNDTLAELYLSQTTTKE